MKHIFRGAFRPVLVAAALAAIVAVPAARADDTLKVGSAVPNAFSFVPLTVGIQEGIFAKHHLPKIQEYGMGGSAKLQQALIAGSLDIGLGSGPELAFMAKGSPNLAIAQMATAPRALALIADNKAGIHSVADLKGKKIGVSTRGSLTEWLVRTLSKKQGWGDDGIDVTPLGHPSAQVAAMKTGQISGMLGDLAMGFNLEKANVAHVVVNFGDVVPVFIMHVIYANRDFAQKHPDTVRNFLVGWFETIKFMKANRDKVLPICAKYMNTDLAIAGRVYDQAMPMFTTDGHFDPKGFDVLADSFVTQGTLKTKPELDKMVTEKYLPAKAM